MSKRKKKTWRSSFQRGASESVAPGTLSVDPEAPHPVVHALSFKPDDYVEVCVTDIDKLGDYVGHWPVTWISVTGLGDAATLDGIAKFFDIHPLAMEDVVNVHQRAKVEDYGHFLFVICHRCLCAEHMQTEQISLILGKDYILSFQERSGNCLEPVRDRIRRAVGRVRGLGADYLMYSILDAAVDSYFPVLERYGEILEQLEDEIVGHPSKEAISEIHRVKRDLLVLRRAIWPFRDAVFVLLRDATNSFSAETVLHLRDCADHTIRIIDLVETYRELASDLLDVYLSSVSNKMNDVMRILAVITTIFVPPTFIAGVYGMNFTQDMSPLTAPNVKWMWAYPFSISLLFLAMVATIVFVWRRGMLTNEQWGAEPEKPSDDGSIVS